MAVTFSGTTPTYLSTTSVPASKTIKGSPFTFSMWVYCTGSGGIVTESAFSDVGVYMGIVGSGISGSTYTDSAVLSNSASIGTFYLDLEQNNFAEEMPIQGNSTTVNVWRHYAATYDGSNTVGGCKIYENGAVVTPASTSNNLSSTVAWNRIIVGGFNGAGEDAWFFNRVLSATEIKMLYQQGHQADIDFTSIVGHWPLLNGGSAGVDWSGQGRNLTATGTVSDSALQAPLTWRGRSHTVILPAATVLNIAGAAATSSALAGNIQAQVASALANGSALTGALIQTQVLASSLADGSALAGSLTMLVAGALADSSALTGALVQTNALVSALADGSALTGTLQARVTGALADGSALTGALVQAQPLAGALADGSALAGALVQTYAVAGSLADSSALAGSISVTVNMAGAMASGSALAGAAVQTNALAGAAASGSALTGALVQAQPLAGATASGSALAGLINTNLNVAGALADSSALTGAVIQNQQLAGTPADSSTLAGNVQTLVSGALSDTSGLTGALTVQLAAALSSSSALSGVVSIQTNMAGALGSGSALRGDLTGGSSVAPYAPSGWFDGGDSVAVNAQAHGEWLDDLSATGQPHTPWRNEITITGIPTPHSPWSET